MLDKRIIHPAEDGSGGVVIIIPAPDATLEQLLQAVPEGYPYKIIDVADMPTDRTFRDAWEYVE